jgi:hypothetical protein
LRSWPDSETSASAPERHGVRRIEIPSTSTRGGLIGHFARSFRDLDRPREAERFARWSIQACQPTHPRTRVQRDAILATTHAQQGDLEGACAVGRQAVEAARQLRSTRTVEEVTRVVTLMNASKYRPARELAEQARDLHGPDTGPTPAS